MRRNFQSLTVPIITVVTAFIINGIILSVAGCNPFQTSFYFFSGAFSGSKAVSQTIFQITPLIFTGLAVAFSFRAGLFNLGVQGQVLAGGLTAVILCAFENNPVLSNPVTVILLVSTAGFIYAAASGILKTLTGVHEVISTMILYYIALNAEKYILISQQGNMISGGTPLLSAPLVGRIQNGPAVPGIISNYGIIIALACAAGIWFILEKSVTGYEIRVAGYNPSAAVRAGINVKGRTVLAIGISGALASLAGAGQVLGGISRDLYSSGQIADYGFAGITVALLGKNRPFGVLLSAALIGTVRSGAIQMQSRGYVPVNSAAVFQAAVIVLIASENIIRFYLKKYIGAETEGR